MPRASNLRNPREESSESLSKLVVSKPSSQYFLNHLRRDDRMHEANEQQFAYEKSSSLLLYSHPTCSLATSARKIPFSRISGAELVRDTRPIGCSQYYRNVRLHNAEPMYLIVHRQRAILTASGHEDRVIESRGSTAC